MLSLFIKFFIKNSEDTSNPQVREKYGVLCGFYGIFLNFLLFGGKLFAGIITASIAMTADAFNNLSDAGSSLISVIGFKLSGKKPDPGHPFGHGRIEYLAGLGVSAMIIIMGYELLISSVDKIRNKEAASFSIVAVIILVASILVKFYMAFYSRKIGKKIDSSTLLATSTDSLSDTIATSAVLLTSIISHFFNINLDGYAGLCVGALIIWAGINAAKDVISPLLGEAPSPEFIKEVEQIVMSYDEIVGIHDLIVHNYGPGRLMITLHAEVPSNKDINDIHDVVDNAERELTNKLNCHATIHMDPVSVGDPFVDELKNKVKSIANSIDGIINVHDFRVVRGTTHTNLIFDIVASFDLKLTDEEITEMISSKIKEIDATYFCVITVDRDYSGN